MNIPTRYRSLRRKKENAKEAVPALPALPTVTESKEPTRRGGPSSVLVQVLGADVTVSAAIAPTTTASGLIGILQRQSPAKFPYKIQSLRVVEFCLDYGLRRELLAYELVADVVKGWDSHAKNCLRIVLSESAQSASPPEYVPPVCGWVKVKLKPTKWSKRWAQTENGVLYVSKKKGKDRVALSNLGQVNLYSLQSDYMRKIACPSRLCFALKSHESHALFEDQSEFLRFLCCEDAASYDMWVHAIQNTRAISVYAASKEKMEAFATSATQTQPSAPLISPAELKQPDLARHVSTRRQMDAEVISPSPEHIAVTKDSLLDRLLHGENVASTSLEYPTLLERASSSKRPNYNAQVLEGEPSGKKPDRVLLDERATGTKNSTLLDRRPSTKKDYSADERGSRRIPRPADDENERRPDARDSPVSSFSFELDNVVTVEVPEDEENMPLYKKLQQLDLKIASNNPFLDPETSVLNTMMSVHKSNSLRKTEDESRTTVASAPTLLAAPVPVRNHSVYHSHSQSPVRELRQSQDRELRRSFDDRDRYQRDRSHDERDRIQRRRSTNNRRDPLKTDVVRSRTVADHHAVARDSEMNRRTSVRTRTKPLITVVDEDRALFHQGSLLARMHRDNL